MYNVVMTTQSSRHFLDRNFAADDAEVYQHAEADDAGSEDKAQPASNFSWNV